MRGLLLATLALPIFLCWSAPSAFAVGPVTPSPTKVWTIGDEAFIDSITVEASSLPTIANENQFRMRVSTVRATKSEVFVPGGIGGLLNDVGNPVSFPELEDQIRSLLKRSVAEPDAALAPQTSAAISMMAAPRILALAVFAAIVLHTDQRIETKRWLIIEELKPTAPGFEAFQPCRIARWEKKTSEPISGFPRAVACPIPDHAEEVPPSVYVNAGWGNDIVDLSALPTHPPATEHHEIDGDAGDDILIGSGLDDVLIGNDGSDGIYGKGGDDEIWGHKLRNFWRAPLGSLHRDDDVLWGGSGQDIILGSWGNDLIDGGDGDDNARPWDVVRTGYWDFPLDYLTASAIPNAGALQGGLDRDVVIGGAGRDTMMGNEDGDTLLAKESDLGDPEAADPDVNCSDSGLALPYDDDYLRRSNGDVVHACDRELLQPVGRSDVFSWQPPDPAGFPWRNWPVMPFPP